MLFRSKPHLLAAMLLLRLPMEVRLALDFQRIPYEVAVLAVGKLNIPKSASEGTLEHNIQNARRYYNAVVDFNTKILQIPTNIFAGILGYKQREFFEVSVAADREVPKVSFGSPTA